METTVDEQGHEHTTVRLNRDLSRGNPMRHFSGQAAFLPHPPEAYLDEAFEEHNDCLCVPRQIAVWVTKVCRKFAIASRNSWKRAGRMKV